MKKSLIALAVLGFAGTAMAQSSVTLYGVADAGVSRTQSRVVSVDANENVVVSKKNTTAFSGAGTMNNGTSRLGVRGVEDLGGGLKVGFNFETGLNLTDGSTAGAGAGYWGRAANLWIGGNWGTVTMGRQLNPSFWAAASWELSGFANYSVVANTFGWGADNHRHSSMLVYKTPNMGGFTASVGYILKDNARDLGNGYAGAKWDLNAIYANGPIAVGITANKAKGEKTSYSLGGKYNFGQFALAASYNNVNATDFDTTDPNNWVAEERFKLRGFTLGGQANLGAFTVLLDLARETKKEATDLITGTTYKGKKNTNVLLEGKYALSKRTFAYAAYLRVDRLNNFGVGIRHNF